MTKEEIKEMEHKLSVNSSKSTDLNGHIMVLNEVKPKGKVLFLQLDNVYRENKNTTVMEFMSYLVNAGYFERIEVSFLPVGHTHNDVDILFSLISRKIFPCVITGFGILKELVLQSTEDLHKDKVILEKKKMKK